MGIRALVESVSANLKLVLNENLPNNHKVVFKGKWVSLKESPEGFQYLERKNKNSIAMMITRDTSTGIEVYARYQPTTAYGTDVFSSMICCPVTGSIEQGEEYSITAQRECLEEAGFKVTREDMNSLGEYIVGTQTNEICYCYHVDVTGKEPTVPKGDGTLCEGVSYNKWIPIEEFQSSSYSGSKICSMLYNSRFNGE
jgi:ADP-ribose pyrophosphatase YjhB (NUDIX family)